MTGIYFSENPLYNYISKINQQEILSDFKEKEHRYGL